MQQGEFQKAQEILLPFLEAYDAQPYDLDYQYGLHSLARLADGQGDYEKSISIYQQLITTAETMGVLTLKRSATNNLLVALRQLGRDEEALELAEEVLALNPPASDVLRYNLATSYTRLGRFEEARKLYLYILEAEGMDQRTFTTAWLGLAKVQYHTDDLPAYRASLHRALDELAKIDFPHTRATVVNAVLEIGENDHRERLKPFLVSLKRETLDLGIRQKLEDNLAKYPGLLIAST